MAITNSSNVHLDDACLPLWGRAPLRDALPSEAPQVAGPSIVELSKLLS
jgi:hypothetical protein